MASISIAQENKFYNLRTVLSGNCPTMRVFTQREWRTSSERQWMEWLKRWPDLLQGWDFISTTKCDLWVGVGGNKEKGATIQSQAKMRERARGRSSLCQSWQIDQLPVRCGEEGRRGRRGRLKGPWQAGRRRRSLPWAAGGSALVAGRTPRTLFWRWMISYLEKQVDRYISVNTGKKKTMDMQNK